MTQTAGQILGNVVPDRRCLPQNVPYTTSTIPARPRFPDNVREWIRFFRDVRRVGTIFPLPGGLFPTGFTSARPLRIEEDAKTRLRDNVLAPVEALLPAQGQEATFCATPTEFVGASDYVLCTNNLTVAKMTVEKKTRHNFDLCGYNFWQIYRYNDRRGIMNPRFGDRRFDPNFRFKKRILSQIFGEMACNGLHYAILSNYSDTYFLKREETNPTTLYISRIVKPTDTNPTLRECVYYISRLAIDDNVGGKFGHVDLDSYSSNDDDDDDDDSSYHDPDDYDDPDYDPDDDSDDSDDDGDDYAGSGKRKRTSKSSSKPIASSSKGITTVDKYIGGGSFGKVFSGHYDNQDVAWKTCDAYKKQEEMKTLKHEAHIYSILKECQGAIFFFIQ